MPDTMITLIGNLTADPELKYTKGGDAVAEFTVASTPRTKRNGEWVDGDTLYVLCKVWREHAENCAESLVKGTRVVVLGKLVQRSYETRDGVKGKALELNVDELGASLRYATAKPVKASRPSRQPEPKPGREAQVEWVDTDDAPF